MNLVFDACVVAKWLFSERNSDEAQLLLSSQFVLFAPSLILVELASVIWKKSRRSEISKSKPYIETQEHMSDVVVLCPQSDLMVPAIALATHLNPPVYDCFYLSCALESGAPSVTEDEHLAPTSTHDNLIIDVWNICHSEVAQKLYGVG